MILNGSNKLTFIKKKIDSFYSARQTYENIPDRTVESYRYSRDYSYHRITQENFPIQNIFRSCVKPEYSNFKISKLYFEIIINDRHSYVSLDNTVVFRELDRLSNRSDAENKKTINTIITGNHERIITSPFTNLFIKHYIYGHGYHYDSMFYMNIFVDIEYY